MMGDFLAMFIVLYLSGCLVARFWIDIMTQDRDIKQVWLSWVYIIKTIITWDWKGKRRNNRLGDLSNKEFVILYNYENNKYNSEFEFIARSYIKNYGNRLKDAYIYANYENTESLISTIRNELSMMEDTDNILNIFKSMWLSYKYNNSINTFLANNDFSIDKLVKYINSSLKDIHFDQCKLCIGTGESIDFVLKSNSIKGRSLLIIVNNLDITYKIV